LPILLSEKGAREQRLLTEMATLNDLIQRCEEASKSLILIHRKQEWPKNVNLRELAYPISITKIETNESEIPEHFEVHERVRSKYPMNRRYVKMLEKTLDIGKIKEVRYVIDTTPGDTEDWLYVLFEGDTIVTFKVEVAASVSKVGIITVCKHEKVRINTITIPIFFICLS